MGMNNLARGLSQALMNIGQNFTNQAATGRQYDHAMKLYEAKAQHEKDNKDPYEGLSGSAQDWYLLTGSLPDISDPAYLRYAGIKAGGGGKNPSLGASPTSDPFGPVAVPTGPKRIRITR